MFGAQFKKKRSKYIKMMKNWQQVELEVSLMPEFTEHDTFTVVLQPFAFGPYFPNTTENKTDNTYLSRDCFHFSQKSDAAGNFKHTMLSLQS